METRGKLSVDPGSLEADGSGREIEVVVPYTGAVLTRKVLERLPALTAGLSAHVLLLAVHATSNGECPSATHAFLVEKLVGLATCCPVPVDAEVVLARTREDGFRHVLKRQSVVLVGSRKRFWRTGEEELALSLVADGHKVALVHVEDVDA